MRDFSESGCAEQYQYDKQTNRDFFHFIVLPALIRIEYTTQTKAQQEEKNKITFPCGFC
jgi:hypothetical protein